MHYSQLDRIEWKLGYVIAVVNRITRQEAIQMASLAALAEKVTENTAVTSSVLTLIAGLAQQIRDAATDPAAIEALAAEIEANSTALAAAVTANTPVS